MQGFDDKLLQLFQVVFERLLSFRGRTGKDGLPDGIEDGRFNVCVEMLQRKYQNSGKFLLARSSPMLLKYLCR